MSGIPPTFVMARFKRATQRARPPVRAKRGRRVNCERKRVIRAADAARLGGWDVKLVLRPRFARTGGPDHDKV